MAHSRRKTPRKALTRKDFRYKRDWKYDKENGRKEDKREEGIGPPPEWAIMILTGFAIIFFKFIVGSVLAIDTPSIDETFYEVIKYSLIFIFIGGINVLGHEMARAKGIKTRIIGVVITIFSFADFIVMVGVLIIPNS